jgi:hypothetical protein
MAPWRKPHEAKDPEAHIPAAGDGGCVFHAGGMTWRGEA